MTLLSVRYKGCSPGCLPVLQRLLRVTRPDAIVMVRTTPDQGMLKAFAAARKPVVMIHADRLHYPSPPVLANVVPRQEEMKSWLEGWAMQLGGDLGSEGQSAGEIVVVAMPNETRSHDYDAAEEGVPPSIRNHRKELVLDALAGLNPILETIPDYSFRHALGIYERHQNARAFVCLSDEVAVGIKHLLQVTGKRPLPKIVGFDNSRLAKLEKITSFGQHLDELGELAAKKLSVWFSRASGGAEEWLDYEELSTDLHLELRDAANREPDQ